MLHGMPRQDALGMPTRLGDILRASERRPADKYGLDTIACWTALWLLLPAETKTELVQARSALDNAARAWLWGALFVVWTPWTWLALPVAIVVPALAYYVGILAAATLFGELTVSAFDLYRFRLYDSLHLPRPSSPILERRRDGPRVTRFLWTGLYEPGVQYVEPPATDGSGLRNSRDLDAWTAAAPRRKTGVVAELHSQPKEVACREEAGQGIDDVPERPAWHSSGTRAESPP
jgi:hypothetical protein